MRRALTDPRRGVPHHHDLHPDLGAAGHPPVDRRLDARLRTVITVSHVLCSTPVDGYPYRPPRLVVVE
jgi:hypothetical protein